MRKKWIWLIFVLFALNVASCVTTPVTNRSALILVSEEEEQAIGKQGFSELLKGEKLSADPRLNRIFLRVAKRISKVSDMPDLDWEYKLIDSKTINAMVAPGGKVVFYTGILPICKNEAGMAAVMGHEAAHAIARHTAQRMSHQMLLMGLLSLAAINFSESEYKNLIMGALGLGATYGFMLPFSRDHESESDHIGMIYMARAGYDPKEAVKVWERMSAQRTVETPEFVSTHPSDQTRIEQLQKILPEAEQIYQSAPQKHGLGEAF